MPDITKGKTFSSGDTVTAADLNSLLDDAVINNDVITADKIADGAVGATQISSGAVGSSALADDSVTSAKVADGQITSALLADDSVTSAKVADNAVGLSHLEDGTQGDILYYGASGAPARLASGASGQRLTSQGSGADPYWADVDSMGITSAQGTATSTALNSTSADTKTGSVTLTLPTGKTWVWVKVVFATRLHTANCISGFTIKAGQSGGTLSEETNWVGIGHTQETTNSESDNMQVTYTKEGVPSVTNQSLDIETYSRLGGVGDGGSAFGTGDQVGIRALYAVGKYQ